MALRRALHWLVKTSAVAVDAVHPPPTGVVVLAYHRVGGGSGLAVDLDPALFMEQLRILAAHHRTVTLDTALDLVRQPEGTPAVAVTFDDGTADFMDHALPAIVATQVPVTYYIATDFIEQQRPFPDNGRPLSWRGLAEAASTGLVTVGSHTHSHAVMDKIPVDAAADEARRSAELIEDRLGVAADHFAYPKGVFGGQANAAAVAARYRSAALANSEVNRYGATDPWRLGRTPIQQSDGLVYFNRKVAGGMALEGRLRTALNRRRYRSASN